MALFPTLVSSFQIFIGSTFAQLYSGLKDPSTRHIASCTLAVLRAPQAPNRIALCKQVTLLNTLLVEYIFEAR